ncbi:MAG: hypothetical protein WBK97_07665 [Bacteroidales bacterium]|jgi:hypothetical protein
MKRLVLLAAVIMGLTACHNQPEVPGLNLELPQSLKKNKELREFVLQAQKDANNLAAACVKMHAKAQPFLEADFDRMDPEQQEALVKLDYEYAELWYTHNVKAVARAMKLMQYIEDRNMPQEEKVDLSKTMAQINQFVQDLKDTYGEDMQLDPYPAEVEGQEVPDIVSEELEFSGT